ncbi:MAG: Glycoside hydrolase family 48, partial [Microgenomates group bacterium GW2011_GWA2_46_7]
DQTIAGTITSNGTTPITNAWVWAEKVTSATDFTPNGGWSGDPTDPAGNYSLAVSNGYWLIHANAPGYKESKYVVAGTPTTVRVNSDSPADKNITLIVNSGFTAKAPQSQSITPANATTFNDTVNGVSMEIPANALGSDSSSNTSLTVSEVVAPDSTVAAPLEGLGKEISAVKKVSATESQSITTLDSGSATITITYDDADIPEGISEDQLTLSYYDSSAGQWVEILAVQDTTLNTLTGTTTHFSTFAPTYPTGSTPPVAPGTPTGTAGNATVTISWTAATDDVGVTGYEVYRSTTADGTYTNISGNATADGGWNPAVLVTSTTYTDSTVSNGTSYYYKVAAYDAAQNQSTASSASAEVMLRLMCLQIHSLLTLL